MGGKMLAQRREGPAQLVAAHRTEVFAFQPDVGIILLAQMIVPLQRRFGKELAQGAGGGAGGIGELGHDPDKARIACRGKVIPEAGP